MNDEEISRILAEETKPNTQNEGTRRSSTNFRKETCVKYKEVKKKKETNSKASNSREEVLNSLTRVHDLHISFQSRRF